MKSVVLAAVSTASLAMSSGAVASSAQQLQVIRSIEGVNEYRLGNGLQVLLFRDDSSTTATVNITYKVGSRFEGYGESGMAHLLEHLNFKGTPRHPKIPDELASRGAQANATTSEDRTNYFETFPATQSNVEWALELEADRMLHSFIAKEDLDSEMTVVRNEFEQGENDAGNVLRERVLETAYVWHNYGKPTIGARSDIENVPIEKLRAFYHTYYQPDNAVLIVAGRFDERETLARIQRAFGSIPRPVRVLPVPYTQEPTQDGEREVTLRRAGGQQFLIQSYHIPADAHADSAALQLLAVLLNDRPSGRLYSQLVQAKLAADVGVRVAGLHDAGYMMFSVSVAKDGDLEVARARLAKLIESLATEPFSTDELDRAQALLANNFQQLMSSSAAVAANLSENVAAGDWRLLFWDRDQLRKVALVDLQRVAAAYLVTSNVTTGKFLPTDKAVRAEIPNPSPLDALLRGYLGGQAIKAADNFDPTPSNIEARTVRGTIGSLRTAFLQKGSRGDRVNAVIQLHFGDATSLQSMSEIGRLTAAMLMRGTQQHTRRQLNDELTKLNATMNIQGSADRVSVAIETVRDNLVPALQIAAEVLEKPLFLSDELDEIKRGQLAQIEGSRVEPQPLAVQAVRRALSPYPKEDFRYAMSFDEIETAIEQVSIEDLRQFHNRFYGASKGEVAVVGSFDVAQVTEVLNKKFGQWTSAYGYERVPAAYKEVSGTSEVIRTPDKSNAVFLSARNLALRDDDPDYPALVIGNAILGGGFMNSRLATRIRQQEGLSYSIASSLNVSSLDPVGSFSILAICAPANIGKVERGVEQEVARALADGFTSQEVAAAKSGILQSRIVGRSTDSQLAARLADYLYLARDFYWDSRFEDSLKAATADSVLLAARRFFDTSKMLVVEAGDFDR
ncbi:MAG: pitrilysin family protein [Gammaproteobacteria bacterium]